MTHTKDEALKLVFDLASMHHTDDGYAELRSKVRQLVRQLDKEALAQPAPVQPVAANKDAVFAASIEFIGTLTGMSPPPIEVAPPEVLKPFRDFTEKVCAIFATPPAAQPATVQEHEPENEPLVSLTSVQEPSQREFENWLRSKWTAGYAGQKLEGRYTDKAAQSFWECWQAAHGITQKGQP
jgi:hypothetical protein